MSHKKKTEWRIDGSVWLENYSESREKRCTHPLNCKAKKERGMDRGTKAEERKKPKELSGVGGTRRAAER